MKSAIQNPLHLVRLLVPVFGALIACGLLPASAQAYTPPANNRVDFNFNYDWKFIKSDVPAASATVYAGESSWTSVSLPHTWNDDKYREWIGASNDPKADPMRPSGEYFGKAWYRKHFTIPNTYVGRKVILEFQGIGRMGKFWVNGTLLGTHENGIGPGGIDITNAITFGADNVIAVRVDNNQNSQSEEYPGVIWPYGVPFNVNYGGINRDVTLHIVDKTYQTFPLYRNLGTSGTYVYAKPDTINTLAKTATITVDAEVKNESGASKTATIEAVAVDQAGNVAYTLPISSSQAIANGATAHLITSVNATNVKFWSPEYPYLYDVYTILKVGGTVVDVQKFPFGVRKFTFARTLGLQVNGHPLYLDGYAPRSTMEWAAVGIPPDWMVDYDFDLIRQSNGNFLRPMHGAPRMAQVQASDKFGVVMVVPAVSSENDPDIVTAADQTQWQMKKDIMRDVVIYFRNNTSVLFYEGCNGALSPVHQQEMVDIAHQWDPNTGRWTGSRTNDPDKTQGIREYSSTMDLNGLNKFTPLWDAEYARAEGPRRVWDVDSPMLNPRWNGVTANTITTPAAGTVNNTTAKYLKDGYFYIASTYHQALGLNTADADAICDYLDPVHPGYFRLNSSEDMMLENVCKYWGRYMRSVFVQAPAISDAQGIMVGGAKIIWADSYTDGRMKDMEVARTSGAVDAVRLPKTTFYGLQVAQADPDTQPMVYIASHWNYPPGTVRSAMFVVSNLPHVKLQTYNTSGQLVTDYGEGTTNILPAGIFGDMVNHYAYKFTNVTWQAGSVKATAYRVSPTEADAITTTVSTAGTPAKLRITPIVGPEGWKADGSDIAMFDVEVLDSNNKRCPTYEDKVTFTWSGAGTFLGGYNSGKRYSTHLPDDTSTTYTLNIEAGINRVFARATRTTGTFTLNVTGTGLTGASGSATSAGITVTNGLSSYFPQTYSNADLVSTLSEPAPIAEGTPPPPPSNAPNPASPDFFKEMVYTGGHAQQATVLHNIQGNEVAYMDSTTIRLPATLPRYLIGADYIKPFKSDGAETTSTDQYQFDLNHFSYVYQVVDAANGMPNHNDNAKYEWVKLPETVTINGRSMKIYKSRLMQPYENVYLACNGKENDLSGFDSGLGFNAASNMYLLFVVSAEQELQLPTNVVSATDSQSTNTPEKAIDANPATRWNAASGATVAAPKVFNIDLGRKVLIGSYQIGWNSADTKYSQYKVELSANNVDWTNSLDMSANVNMGGDEYRVPVTGAYAGRYVRISVTYTSGGASPAIIDLKVWGVLDAATASAVPTVTSALTATGQGGYNFTYTVTASGTPTGFTAQGLPDGWTINGNTGVISGITMSSGTFPITVSGINTAGAGSALVNVTLAAPPPIPVVNSASTYSAQAAVSIPTASAYQITATNLNFTPISYGATGLPSGATISTSTGRIAGTPKYPGSYPVTIKATNPGGTGTKTLTFTVTPNGAAPSITSSGTATATQGVAFSYQTAATNTPTIWDAIPLAPSTTLPPGVSRSTSTGLLSGTPTVPGTYTLTLSCSNAGGTATKTLTITVAPNPDTPTITNTLSITGHTGVAITSLQVQTTPAATGFSVSPALPAGLMLNATTGLITGTPTAATAGTVTFTVTATKNGYSGTKPLTVNIGATLPTPVINSGINAVGAVGAPFSYQITTTAAAVSYAASGLPGGLSINTSTGLISGTPTGTGTSNVTLTATNASNNSDTQALSIVITAAGVDINLALNKAVTASSQQNTQGAPVGAIDGVVSATSRWESQYSDPQWIEIDLGSSRQINSIVLNWQSAAGKDYLLQTSNNGGTGGTWTNFVAPIVGNATIGVLPAYNGSAVARYVRMYGTLRKTQYGFSIIEFQIFGPATGGSNPVPAITSPATWNITQGSAASYQITATNSPTSFSATGLPAGLSVNTTSGLISGTPTATGTTNATLRASNGNGQGPAFTLAITVGSGAVTPSITSALAATATVNTSFSYQITASNGPITSYSATGLPAGLTVNTGTGLISGTPTATGTSNVALRATNSTGQGAASTLVLTVGTAGNLALNQPVTYSSFQVANEPAMGNDGGATSRWAAVDGTFPQWWAVDLGASHVLTAVEIDWINPTTRAYKYKIEGGTDGVNFPTLIKDNTANTTIGASSDPTSANVRYVRITVTGSTTGGFASFYECRVLGN